MFVIISKKKFKKMFQNDLRTRVISTYIHYRRKYYVNPKSMPQSMSYISKIKKKNPKSMKKKKIRSILL